MKMFMSFITAKIRGVTKASKTILAKLRLYRILPESQPKPVAII